MARRPRAPKEKSRKKVTVKLLKRLHAGEVVGPYRIMERLIKAHHPHLEDAKIAIAWRFGWKSDADGHTTLGQAKKGSDLDRELHDHDFVILLNHERWNNSGFTETQMDALMDHELCHCEVAKDSNGEPKTDDSGRTCYRIRKHDVEEFREVFERHGFWKSDLEFLADKVADKTSRPLLDGVEAEATAKAEKPKGRKKKAK